MAAKCVNKKWQPIWWNTNLFWLGWLTHLEALAWKKLGPGKDGCPAWQTRQPPLAGQPANHINIIKKKMRHYLDRKVTPPKKATSPILGPLPPCKQALTLLCQTCSSSVGEDRGWNQENRAQEVVEERVENGKDSKLPPKTIKFLFSTPRLFKRWIALSTR